MELLNYLYPPVLLIHVNLILSMFGLFFEAANIGIFLIHKEKVEKFAKKRRVL